MSIYQKGQSVKLTTTFTDAAGAAANPTTVTCKVQKPDLTEATYTSASTPSVANPTTGAFELLLVADQSGIWVYRWEGATGAAPAVDEDSFSVLGSAF